MNKEQVLIVQALGELGLLQQMLAQAASFGMDERSPGADAINLHEVLDQWKNVQVVMATMGCSPQLGVGDMAQRLMRVEQHLAYSRTRGVLVEEVKGGGKEIL